MKRRSVTTNCTLPTHLYKKNDIKIATNLFACVFRIITTILKAVVSGLEVGQLAVLRAFRVLRALKTMSVIPGTCGEIRKEASLLFN